jgi:CRP/FNR family cyclic AMP-dependent transcriptional regulator
MAQDMASELAQFSILQPLSDGDLQRLQQVGRVRTAPAGHLLINEREASTAVYFLLAGEARVFITGDDGKEATVNTLKAGSWFGELALLGNGLRSASVITTTAARFLVVPGPALRGILISYPESADRLLEALGQRIRGLTETVRGYALGDVYHRLANLFREMSVEQDGQRVILRPPPQRELAARIGASREMVARVLRELRRGGYVDTSRQRIVLKKPLPARF